MLWILDLMISITRNFLYLYLIVPVWTMWIRWLAARVCRAYDKDTAKTNEIEIIYHSPNLLIVNKPYDVNISASRRERESAWQTQMNRLTVEFVLQKHFPWYKLRNLHQIDYPTSGIYIIALNKQTASLGGRLFIKHHIAKEYRAIVRGHVTKWLDKRIEVPIGFDDDFPLKRKLNGSKSQHAITEAKVIKTGYFGSTPCTLMSLRPITGRTHQLRLHMLSEGHPIIGDFFYESALTPSFRMMLHSYRTIIPFSKIPLKDKYECRYTKYMQHSSCNYGHSNLSNLTAKVYLYLHDLKYRLEGQTVLHEDVIVETADPFSSLIKSEPSSDELDEYKKLEAKIRLDRFQWVCENVDYKQGLLPAAATKREH